MSSGIILVTLIFSASICHGSVFMRIPTDEQQGKIVGGDDIEIEDAPYQISLAIKGSGHNCGGSIISDYLILTAAHCVYGLQRKYEIRAGSSYTTHGGQVVEVEAYKYHPYFNYNSMDYDVALLKLKEPLVFSKYIAPIKVVDENFKVNDGDSATVTGWGTTKEGGSLAGILQRVSVPIISQSDCSNAYADILKVTDRMICAGVVEGGKDSCQGDSGGPLTVSGYLTGVVSWGIGCARPKMPGVYTRLSSLTNWIAENSKALSSL